jgi:pyruvate/2-oxoglutarate dehydrogenase complex dihydrolipoamide dehydrogenase (E3) component
MHTYQNAGSECLCSLSHARAGDYGVTIGGPVGVDMRVVKARKDAIAGASRRGVERSLKTLEGCTVYEGHARFVGDKRVAVNGVELSADRIFINVGGPIRSCNVRCTFIQRSQNFFRQ